jgi:hypothetical protein
MLDMHRFLGAAALVFTAVHVASIVLDSYVSFSLVQVLVPFTSTWKPSAVAWGIVTLWLLAAVEVTSLVRNRIPQRVWRLTHVLAFPLFAFSTVHVVTAGTDSAHVLLRATLVAANLAVVGLTAWRLWQLDQRGSTSAPAPTSRIPAIVRAGRGQVARGPAASGTARPGGPVVMPAEPPMAPEPDAPRTPATAGSQALPSRLSPGGTTLS